MVGTNRIPVKEARFSNIGNTTFEFENQRRMLDLVQAGNQDHLSAVGTDSQFESRIASFELAFRMQSHAPEVFDFSGETEETLSLYGVDDKVTENYGR